MMPEGTRRTFNLGREMTFHEQMGFSTLPLKILDRRWGFEKLACLIWPKQTRFVANLWRIMIFQWKYIYSFHKHSVMSNFEPRRQTIPFNFT